MKTIPSKRGDLVTVAVLVFNQRDYVAECLDSVVASRYDSLEIIVIDDASSDDSVRAVEAWIERNRSSHEPRFIRHAANRGICSTLNEAVAAARGTYFLPLAADDRLLPNGIADRVAYLESRPEKLAVFGDCRFIDAGGAVTAERGLRQNFALNMAVFEESDLLAYPLVFRWAMPGPVFLCRLEAYRVVGLYDPELFMDDLDVYLKLAATGRLGYVDALVSDYRRHPTNTVQTQAARVWECQVITTSRRAPLYAGVLKLRLKMPSWHSANAGRTASLRRKLVSAAIRATTRATNGWFALVHAWAWIQWRLRTKRATSKPRREEQR